MFDEQALIEVDSELQAKLCKMSAERSRATVYAQDRILRAAERGFPEQARALLAELK